MRGMAGVSDVGVADRVADAESEPDRRERLPAGRIVLVRFTLVEVELSTEDERLTSLLN